MIVSKSVRKDSLILTTVHIYSRIAHLYFTNLENLIRSVCLCVCVCFKLYVSICVNKIPIQHCICEGAKTFSPSRFERCYPKLSYMPSNMISSEKETSENTNNLLESQISRDSHIIAQKINVRRYIKKKPTSPNK